MRTIYVHIAKEEVRELNEKTQTWEVCSFAQAGINNNIPDEIIDHLKNRFEDDATVIIDCVKELRISSDSCGEEESLFIEFMETHYPEIELVTNTVCEGYYINGELVSEGEDGYVNFWEIYCDN